MTKSNHIQAIERGASLAERVAAEAADQGKHVEVEWIENALDNPIPDGALEITPATYSDEELELGEWYRAFKRNYNREGW